MTVVCEQLQREGFVITAFFYNPNIHPWKERERRLKALSEYADSKDIRLEIDEEYPLEENIRMLLDAENRCYSCFLDRLSATADKARELGIENFSTTLSVSPYQNQSFIMEAGNAADSTVPGPGIQGIVPDPNEEILQNWGIPYDIFGLRACQLHNFTTEWKRIRTCTSDKHQYKKSHQHTFLIPIHLNHL